MGGVVAGTGLEVCLERGFRSVIEEVFGGVFGRKV